MAETTRKPGAGHNTGRYVVGMLVLLVVFIAATGGLLLKRFKAGDLYPAYSSLRSDPLGIKVLAESFEEAGLAVERNYEPLFRRDLPPTATLFIGGLHMFNSAALNSARARENLVGFVEQGGRLVITLFPQNVRPSPPAPSAADNDTAVLEDTLGEEPANPPEPSGHQNREWGELLGFSIEALSDQDLSDSGDQARGRIQGEPVALSWHGNQIFTDLSPEWQVLLTRHRHPVLVARALGSGTVVLATDSYFVSNESLWRHRRPQVLSWLAGSSRLILFDEMHHGISSRDSLAGYIRKYDLLGAVFILLAAALLFVWRNSCALSAGRRPDGQDGRLAVQYGKGQYSGLVNIIRRYQPENILQACVQEWRRTGRQRHRDRDALLVKMAAVIGGVKAQSEQEVVNGYKAVCSLLARKK